MGDRANCVVRQNSYGEETADVWLYTHWGGAELLETVQRALRKNWRWNDDPYLARIIFDEMTAGEHGEETGFGITTRMTDNERSLVVVDPANHEVRIEDATTREAKHRWAFSDFCTLDVSQYEI